MLAFRDLWLFYCSLIELDLRLVTSCRVSLSELSVAQPIAAADSVTTLLGTCRTVIVVVVEGGVVTTVGDDQITEIPLHICEI